MFRTGQGRGRLLLAPLAGPGRGRRQIRSGEREREGEKGGGGILSMCAIFSIVVRLGREAELRLNHLGLWAASRRPWAFRSRAPLNWRRDGRDSVRASSVRCAPAATRPKRRPGSDGAQAEPRAVGIATQRS